MDTCCGIELEWSAAGGAGTIATSTDAVTFRDLVPDAAGLSPERLLLAAVAASYGIALCKLLRALSLPCTHVAVRADGVIANNSGKMCFTRVTVRPAIRGADVARRDAYKKPANAARDECLIGRSLRGNVAFVIGDVTLIGSAE